MDVFRCPFCGRKAVIYTDVGIDVSVFRVRETIYTKPMYVNQRAAYWSGKQFLPVIVCNEDEHSVVLLKHPFK